MAKPGSTQPDLVSDLARMQARLDDLERKPAPTTLYDTYPCTGWETVERGYVTDNSWSTVGIANVTGMKFDRIEAKFITDRIMAERSEAEVRMAAFKHSHATQFKACVAASSTVRLTGNWGTTEDTGALGIGKWRWIHGLPRGWSADNDEEDSIYTIELQHRYSDTTFPPKSAPWTYMSVYAFNRLSTETTPTGGIVDVGNGRWVPFLNTGYDDAGTKGSWVSFPWDTNVWNGKYKISNMHYCVGMSEEQLPEASTYGWFWYSGGDAEFVRQPDVNEAYMSI